MHGGVSEYIERKGGLNILHGGVSKYIARGVGGAKYIARKGA